MVSFSKRVKACPVPLSCSLQAELAEADFYDSYCLALGPGDTRSALDTFLETVAHTPQWVHSLMSLRNRLVGLFGLKNLGGLDRLTPSKTAAQYQPGDRVGIFTLLSQTADEVLLGDNDKHLRVTLSVQRLRVAEGVNQVSLTTVVKVHNLLGRLYMLPVGPAHKVIAPAVLARAKLAD